MARRQPASRKYRGAQWFWQEATLSFNALSSGSDQRRAIIDRSALTGSSTLRMKLVKAQIYWYGRGMDDARSLIAAVIKDDEAFTAVSLDNAQVVQEMMDSKKLLRGPFMIHTMPDSQASSVFGRMYKTITLKNVEFDNDEDIYMNFTLPTAGGGDFSATAQDLVFQVMGSWKLAV